MIDKLGKYKNGNYTVTIYEDGTKVRFTKDDEFIPAFAENCDVKITDKCSMGCPFCYEGSTPDGKHADLSSSSVQHILDSLHPWTEFALNGNDLDHPQLLQFLVELQRRDILANITVNVNQFMRNFEKIKSMKDNDLIHGIGVSYTKRDFDAVFRSKQLKDVVFHTIAGVTTPEMYNDLLTNKCKVLILGYKDLQRGHDWKNNNASQLESNMNWLKANLDHFMRTAEVASFDNLALDQLDVKSHLTPSEWDTFYMGDDGSFTFYIDLVKGEYAQNSLATERFPIDGKDINEMFQHIISLKK